MYKKGHIPTEEIRKKISDSKKGCKSWSKGLTKETHPSLMKISIKKTGVKRLDITGDKNPAKRPEVRKKLSELKIQMHLDNPETHINRIMAKNRYKKSYISKNHMKLYNLLKDKYKDIELEYPIRILDGLKFLDIAIPSLKINIEYDGEQWHSSEDFKLRDKKRDDALKELGWKVIRINKNNIDSFVESGGEIKMKTIAILGGNGFIGHHLARKLRKEGNWIRCVDIKKYEYGEIDFCDDNLVLDLRDKDSCIKALTLDDGIFDEVYQLAADMGGAGFVFTGENDYEIMTNSLLININISKLNSLYNKILFTSSACAYPEYKQMGVDIPALKEIDAYPAQPDSEYGWEKIISERIYLNLAKNKKVPVKVVRFHNVYGPEGTYDGGREKAPAALCRKIITAIKNKDAFIDIWGDGKQTRSFCYIDDCLKALELVMNSDVSEPINIGRDDMLSINELANIIMGIEGVDLKIEHVIGPLGVRGRNSDNMMFKKKFNWEPEVSMLEGLTKTYKWIKERINNE